MTALHALSLLAPVVTVTLLAASMAGAGGERRRDDPPRPSQTPTPKTATRDLSHEETLRWIAEHRGWRQARKTRPIWVRPVAPDEVGKEFQTADNVAEIARLGYMLCVGVAGEPWFQSLEKVKSKYRPEGPEVRKVFAFDTRPRAYRLYQPSGKVLNWVAKVEGPGIKGFFIKPSYDPRRPLYSRTGGYVVKEDCADPYRDCPDDVWLVQKSLFESTYEFANDAKR
jgi:hypothetical protein